MKIAFIGFGEAGSGLAKGLKQAGVAEIRFYDHAWNVPPYGDVIQRRAREARALMLPNFEEAVVSAEVVISCVTAASALEVAKTAKGLLTLEQLYVDVNAASPMEMERVAATIAPSGAQFVDVAMMGAIPAYLHKVPILCSGPGAERFRILMSAYEMDITRVGDQPGAASAIKMFRSIFMKGLVALLLETMQATHVYRVDDVVLGSLAETMEKNPFMETVRSLVTRGLVHAERRAHELEEVIKTLKSLNVPYPMAQATMEKLQWCSNLGFKEYFKGETPQTLDEVFAAFDEKLAVS
ncbi:MAG: NAD(P)-dependent oxidoreductase [Deltaproteobacteria bacterium]|nr:NAD(P)-dependent oxidoreductase [Deltaproteobacteria bacterium]